MGRLFDAIVRAVHEDRVLVSLHADDRCEERGISAWQVVAGVAEATLVEERPSDEPNPSVIVRQLLIDGTEIEAVWAFLPATSRAKLVTVYIPE